MNTVQEKHIAIGKVVLSAAQQQVILARQLRKKQRFYNKKRLSKKKKDIIPVQMAISAYLSAAQIFAIMQTPIPKYPLGGVPVSGIGIVGERGKEIII